MTFLAAALLIVSAVVHVGWNLIGKRQNPSSAFLLVANTLGFLCLSPVLIFYRRALVAFPMQVWLWLGVTGLFQALYYAALAGAYRTGALSVVYPLARSAAVVFVVLLNASFGLAEQLAGRALGGIALIVLGSFLLPTQRLGDMRLENHLGRSALLALVAALGTSGYSIVDDAALRILRETAGLPAGPLGVTMLCAFFEGVSSSLWLAVAVAVRKQGRASLRVVWSTQLRQAALAGAGIYLAYTLVLLSMGLTRSVSYVVAFRQLSVPLGAVAGILVLGDPPHPPRLIGVAIVFAGLIMVGLS